MGVAPFDDIYFFIYSYLTVFNIFTPKELIKFGISYGNPFNAPRLRGYTKLDHTESGLEYVTYLPPEYNRADETIKHPVLYYLHGATYFFPFVERDVLLTAEQFEKYARISGDSASGSHDGQMEFETSPVIIAPFDSLGWSWWVNGDQINMFDQIQNELIPEVESKYHVYTDRDNTYISGFSMGGFGALVHGFTFQDKFGKILSWDGAIVNSDSLNDLPLSPVNSRAQFGATRENDLVDVAKFNPYNPFRLIRVAATATSQDRNLKEHNSRHQDSQDQDSRDQEDSYTIEDTPVLLISRSDKFLAQHNNDFFTAFTNLGGGDNIQWEHSSLPHTYEEFVTEYGKQAVDFFMGREVIFDDYEGSRDNSHRKLRSQEYQNLSN